MIEIRKATERGHFNHGWLDTYHTFSFGEYYDTRYMNFSCLRVINEDKIQEGGGFPPHPHRDMEIITYVISGELAHKDSMGNQRSILPGEFQRMSAGTGVVHSEFNNFNGTTHLLQVWITPDRSSYVPSYEQKRFVGENKSDFLTLVVSPLGERNSLKINQNVKLFLGTLTSEVKTYALQSNRSAWLQVVKGNLELNNLPLSAGDGAGIRNEVILNFKTNSFCEFLLFDLPSF